MRIRSYGKILFKRYFQPITYMKRRYPKAAKRRRIVKKWINRFGNDIDFTAMMNGPSIFDNMPKDTWQGGAYLIPRDYTFGTLEASDDL